ncbi:hypothetical protein [Streptomyces natalensis]|uniref:hypothetical protein n=1 Tax=Streptomyces natalensis TaxID=68242 RepID=UPI00068BB31F|nr:hypothetical protein [Streptomyces natalensis]
MERFDDDHLNYSRQALARLVLSDASHALAEQATANIGTRHDTGAHRGEFIEQAMHLVEQAQEVLQAAVLYEREKGLSWDAIGEALGGITRQSAHAKYAEAEAQWRRGVVNPITRPTTPKGLASLNAPEAAYQPTATARRLDKWLREHGRPAEQQDEHPVSGHLPTLTTSAAISQLLDAIRHATQHRTQGEDLARLFDRKAELMDRIATEEGREDAREMAAGARARAAEIRSQQT